METKTVLILAEEVDFCMLLCSYLSKKQVNCYYTDDVNEALNFIDVSRPQMIVAEFFQPAMESTIYGKIASIPDYQPNVHIISASSNSPKESSIQEYIDKIIKGIRDWLNK